MTDETLDKVGKRLGNIADLPEELKNQLQATKMDDLEVQLIDVIKSFDGIANLDEILVGFYRKFNVVKDRAFISNKLYRMAKSGLLSSVKGKKGVYKME